MTTTSIEWTQSDDGTPGKTWNPIRGCSRVSAGCERCYAMHIAARFSGPGQPYEGLAKRNPTNWTGDIRLVPEKLAEPLTWKKPCRVFVNSMSDLFHEGVPDEFIDRVFGVMAKAYWHTFQVLTKRPERMAEYFSYPYGRGNAVGRIIGAAKQYPWPGWAMDEVNRGAGWNSFPYPNIWLGTSVENQQAADDRIWHLLNTPAAVRFLSVEPLLALVRLGLHRVAIPKHRESWPAERVSNFWVIVGCESGPGARSMQEDWVRSIRDECVEAGVSFFFKQALDARGHKISLPELDGRRWAEFPTPRMEVAR